MEESGKCRVCGKFIGYRWKGICLGCRYKERLAKAGISLRDPQPAERKVRPVLKCDPKKTAAQGSARAEKKQEIKSPPFWEYYRPWEK